MNPSSSNEQPWASNRVSVPDAIRPASAALPPEPGLDPLTRISSQPKQQLHLPSNRQGALGQKQECKVNDQIDAKSESKKELSKGTEQDESQESVSEPQEPPRLSYHEAALVVVLEEPVVNVDRLKALAWNGLEPAPPPPLPPGGGGGGGRGEGGGGGAAAAGAGARRAPLARRRAEVWQLLLGYLPANRARRAGQLGKRRAEYAAAVRQYFHVREQDRTAQEQGLLHQILVDVPRTYPDIPLLQQAPVQRLMERVLYVWGLRHPASGYVQGISELICPFILVFISDYLEEGQEPETVDVERLPAEALAAVEADCYWCATKLLDRVQDHYTAEQPGIQRMLLRLDDLLRRVDAPLHAHLREQGVHAQQFGVQWMNNLLLRELPVRVAVRAWDTCLSQEGGFDAFHVHLCAALLIHFSDKLQQLDMIGLMEFFQNMPTQEWTPKDIEPLLSQAYIYSTLFDDSPNHLG